MLLVKTIEEIEEIVFENPYALLFVGDSACSTSRALDNKIEEFGKKYPQVKIMYTILEALPSLASKYMIFIAPVIILFSEGKEIYREGRFVEFEKLEKFIV